MVTIETLNPKYQSIVRTLIEEIRHHNEAIVESPVGSYLGVKYGKSLVCAIYPDPRWFYLGHWDPPFGVDNRWLKPIVATLEGVQLYLPKLKARVDYLVANRATVPPN